MIDSFSSIGHYCNKQNSILCFALLIVTLATMIGCGGKSVQQHRIIVPEEPVTLSGSVSVIGVVSAVGEQEGRQSVRTQLPGLFGQVILENQSSLMMIPSESVGELIGSDHQKLMLDRYEKSGVVDTSAILELVKATQWKIRYAFFARIVTDDIKHSNMKYDSSGVAGVKYTVFRKLVIDCDVVDLIDVAPVVHYHDSAFLNSRRWIGDNDTTWNSDDNVLGSVGKGVKSVVGKVSLGLFSKKVDPAYPKPPDSYEMAHKIFTRFAESLEVSK